MRIAQVCMPILPVPPKKYGGVLRIASYLSEELVRQGHTVTLFAHEDSTTRARLIAPPSDCGEEGTGGSIRYSILLGMVARYAKEFDIIHFHLNHWQVFPFVRAVHERALVTFHMPVSRSLMRFFQEFSDIPIVPVSNDQVPADPGVNWRRTIYHGLPTSLYALQKQPEGYCAFIGRLDHLKGPDRAIDIAQAAGVPIKIGGPIFSQEYFDDVLAPRLKNPGVEYVGELDDEAKQFFLGGAIALLFPIQWQEPFGLVMIEAIACGTPVVAFNYGAVPEVITNGVTGFVVSDMAGAAQAVRMARHLDRERCRAEFEKRFSAERMCKDYIEVYESMFTGVDVRLKEPKSRLHPVTGI